MSHAVTRRPGWAGTLIVLFLLWPAARADAQSSSPAEPGVPADWWATVQASLKQAEYAVTWQDQTCLPDLAAAYQAPNRAENLRTYFAPAGPVVIPRLWPEGATEPPWRLDLRLQAWGHTGAIQPAPAAELVAQDNRIEYRRGDLVEWYRNDPEGLAVGWRLEAQPAGGGDAPLHLALAWGGSVLAQGGDGPGLAFTTGEQTVLRLGPVQARDSAGRLLAVQL